MGFFNCRCGEKMTALAPFILRLAVGAVFIVHGYQKITGFAALGGVLDSLGIPAPELFAYVLTFVEFAGGILLVLGLLTHWVGKLLAIDMLVAAITVHIPNGFMAATGGVEFVMVLFAAAVALSIMGAGPWSLDRRLFRQ